MTAEQITNIVTIACWVAFGLVIAVLVLSFVRGLFRGWKYGTYRLIAFAVLITVALVTLRPMANFIGGLNFENLNQTISFTMNSKQISAKLTTLYETGKSIIAQVMTAAGASGSPEAIQNYALAMSQSLVMLLLLFIDGLLLGTLGQLFVLLLWHIAFKHIIPVEKRKIKKLRWVSMLEDGVIGLVVLAMMLFPFTAILNSVNSHYERDDNASNNETVATFTAAIDTYNDSIFSKVFFNWTKGDGTDTYDTQLVNFLTHGDYNGAKADVVATVGTFTDVASLAIKSGLISQDGIQSVQVGTLLTSGAVPELLYTLSDSDLITNVLPVAVAIATSLDPVKEVLGDETCTYLASSTVNWNQELGNLANIYVNLLDTGVLDNLIDSQGNFKFDKGAITALFDPSSAVYGALHSAMNSFDNSKILSHLVSGALSTVVNKEGEAKDDKDSTIQLIDFLPKDKAGKVTAASLSSVDWGQEIVTLYDAFYKLNLIDSTILPGLFETLIPATSSSSSGSSVTTPLYLDPKGQASSSSSSSASSDSNQLLSSLMSLIAEHGDEMSSILVGSTDGEGHLAGLNSDNTAAGGCLFDSTLITTVMPSFVLFLGDAVNTSMNLDSTHKIDLTSIAQKLTGEDVASSRKNFKSEFAALLNVLTQFSNKAAGISFLLNIANTPGIYFDPDGNFDSIDPDLLSVLESVLQKMDGSTILSTVLPKIFDSYLSGTDSPLASLGLPVTFNFKVPNLGTELSKILKVYGDCPDVFSSVTAAGTGSTSSINSLLNNTEELVEVLDLFANSPILNPVDSKNVANTNFYAVLNMAFEKAGLAFSIDPTESKFANLQIGNSTTLDGSYIRDRNGNPIYDGETGKLGVVFSVIGASGVVDQLASLNGASTTQAVDIISKLDIVSLFNAIDDSTIMSSIAGPALDKYFASVLGQGELISSSGTSSTITADADGTYTLNAVKGNYYILLSGSEEISHYSCTTSGSYVFKNLTANGSYTLEVRAVDQMDKISFSNVTDWSKEGRSLKTLVDCAVSVGDLSKLDFLNTDSATIGKLLKSLASSGIFTQNGEYVFPDYIYRKFASSLSGDTLAYFADEGVSASALSSASTLSEKMALTRQLQIDFKSVNTEAAWTNAGGEADAFAAVIKNVMAAGGIDALSKLSSSKVASLESLLDSINQTSSVSRVILYNAISKLSTSLSGGSNSIDFSHINAGYLYNPEKLSESTLGTSTTVNPTEAERAAERLSRTAEIASLKSIIEVVADPTYGILNSQGETDMSKINLGTVSTEYLLSPLLDNMASSQVFNSVKFDQTTMGSDSYGYYLQSDNSRVLSVFESAMSQLVKTTKLYDYNNAGATDYDDTLPLNSKTALTLPKMIQAINNWGSSSTSGSVIENLVNLVNQLQTSSFIDSNGNFSTAALSDVSTYFQGSASQVNAKKTELRDLLTSLNDSELFYRALPSKLQTALNDAKTNVSSTITNELGYANAYCMVSGSDYLPYSSEANLTVNGVNYSEIDGLVEIMANMASLKGADTAKLSSINPDKTTETLALMEQSGIFNSTVVSGSSVVADNGYTCFQLVTKDLYQMDALKTYLYDCTVNGSTYSGNPKDIAAYQAGTYTSAETKAYYLAKSNFPALVRPLDYANKTTLAAQAELLTNQKNDGSSLNAFLSSLEEPAYQSVVSDSNLNFAAISTDQISGLLRAMNQCDLFYDLVPNAVASIANTDELKIADSSSAVDIKLLNPYFSYYLQANLTIGTTANFSARFYDEEIDNLASILGYIKANKASLENMDIDSVDPYMVRSLLLQMNDSYVFHLGGVNKNASTYDENPTFNNTTHTWVAANDLTVFEQMIFRLYNKSGLSDRAYSSYYDYLSYYHTYGATGYVIKLHDEIVKFENGVGEGLHQGDWLSEINAITTDCVTHAGTLEDPYVGLLWTVQKIGITSGTSIAFNPSSLQNYAPDKLNKLLYALNNLDIVDDSLVYTLRNLLTTTTEAKTSNVTADGAGNYLLASPSKDHIYSLYTDYGNNNQTLIATYTASYSTAYTFTGLTANKGYTLEDAQSSGFQLNRFSNDSIYGVSNSSNTYTYTNHQLGALSIAITSNSKPTEVVAKLGSDTLDITSNCIVTTTSAGSTNIYTYHFSPYEINSLPVYAESYTFTGADTITEVSYAYDSPDYFRTQAEMLSTRSEAGLSLKLTTTGTPTIYGVDANHQKTALALTSTGTQPEYVYDLSGTSYLYYKVTSSAEITALTYNGDDQTLSSGTTTWNSSYTNDIEDLTAMLNSLYQGSTYFSFDDTHTLQNFFNDGHSIEGIYRFFTDCSYYNNTNDLTDGSFTYQSRDVMMHSILSYTYSDSTFPSGVAVSLSSNLGGTRKAGDLSNVLTSHRRMEILEGLFDDESSNGTFTNKWLTAETSWLDKCVVDAGMLQASLDAFYTYQSGTDSYIYSGDQTTYSAALALMSNATNSVKLNALMSSLFANPNHPECVPQIGSHILAGQFTEWMNLRYEYLVATYASVFQTYQNTVYGTTTKDVTTSAILSSGQTEATYCPDLYSYYSSATSFPYKFTNLYANNCALMYATDEAVQVVAGLNGYSTKSASEQDAAKTDTTNAFTDFAGLTSGSNSAKAFIDLLYIADLYPYIAIAGFYKVNVAVPVTYVDFSQPNGNGFLNTSTASVAFSYTSIASLFA